MKQLKGISTKSDKWIPHGYKNYLGLIPQASEMQSQQKNPPGAGLSFKEKGGLTFPCTFMEVQNPT